MLRKNEQVRVGKYRSCSIQTFRQTKLKVPTFILQNVHIIIPDVDNGKKQKQTMFGHFLCAFILCINNITCMYIMFNGQLNYSQFTDLYQLIPLNSPSFNLLDFVFVRYSCSLLFNNFVT